MKGKAISKEPKIKIIFDSSKTSTKKGAHAIGCQN